MCNCSEPSDIQDYMFDSGYLYNDTAGCNIWEDQWTGIVVSGAKIGAVLGTLLACFLLDVGRRTSVGATCGFFIVGPLVMSFSNGVTGLFFGRVILGIGVGLSAVAAPQFMSEMSPPSVRGRVVMLYQVFLGLGMCVIWWCGGVVLFVAFAMHIALWCMYPVGC